MIREAIAALVEGRSLSREDASASMCDLMSGEATPAQAAAFLTALRIKGETVEEVAGLVSVMRAKAEHVEFDGPVIDTCGTGGDGSHSLNVSTAAAFVAVGAGLTVAKHGNRSMTSQCGSADVLEELGIAIDLGPIEAAHSLRQAKFAFLFAQRYHPAMKYVAPVRREIGVRTVFNILGPLSNPAGATRQVVGVPAVGLAELMAEALAVIGVDRALVVVGHGGLDEIALSGPTTIFDVSRHGVSRTAFRPEEAGIEIAPLAAIAGGDAATNAAILRAIFGGARGPQRDVVIVNAGAVLVAGGLAATIAEGTARAAEIIDSGAALAALEAAIRVSAELAGSRG